MLVIRMYVLYKAVVENTAALNDQVKIREEF